MPDGFLPFITTPQYAEFVLACDYIHHTRKIGIIFGLAGTGKSWSAIQYVRSQPRIIANGRSPYHYMHLSQGEKTDRSFLNALISSMTGLPRRQMTSGDAMDEAIRLWTKFGYEMLVVDEVLALQPTGIEALRTFHDRGPHLPRIPVVLITVPYVKQRLEHPRYEAFYSRIGRILNFDGLTKEQISYLLADLPEKTPIKFNPKQKDANSVVDTLYTASGGGIKARARFRLLDDILMYCDIHLRKKIVEWKQAMSLKHSSDGDTSPIPKPAFNASLIKEAMVAVQSGKYHPQPEDNNQQEVL